MRQDDCDVDKMLRENAEGQLADFDWDRLHAGILTSLTGARRVARVSRKMVVGGLVAAAAVVVVVGYVCVQLLEGTGPVEPTVADAPADSDDLVASTDPETILLTGQMRLLAWNDPALALHSLWDQQPLEQPNHDSVEEQRNEGEQT